MVRPGPTKTAGTEGVAASLLRLARTESHLTQRGLANAANVPQSTVGRIESGKMQPTLPLLYRLLAAAGLEPRVKLVPYDDRDDVLDALATKFPEKRERMDQACDATVSALMESRHAH